MDEFSVFCHLDAFLLHLRFGSAEYSYHNARLKIIFTYLLTFAQFTRTPSADTQRLQGGPAKVRPTLLVTFECIGKIQ